MSHDEIDLDAPLPPLCRLEIVCNHVDFETTCTVERTGGTAGKPLAWMARVRVRCADCGRDFDFVGLAPGYSQLEPRAGLLGIEAQLPLSPSARDPLDARA
jgi:hypothetical protein